MHVAMVVMCTLVLTWLCLYISNIDMHIILLLSALVLMVLCRHVITVGKPVCSLTCMISYAHVRTLSMQVNGVNLLRIHSTGPYAYALTLSGMLRPGARATYVSGGERK